MLSFINNTWHRSNGHTGSCRGRLQRPSLPVFYKSSLSSLGAMGLGRGGGGGGVARWAGLGPRVESKMAAVSGRSKWRSLGSQVGLLLRWSVLATDGCCSTDAWLLGGTISGPNNVYCLRYRADKGGLVGLLQWRPVRFPHLGWYLVDIPVWFSVFSLFWAFMEGLVARLRLWLWPALLWVLDWANLGQSWAALVRYGILGLSSPWSWSTAPFARQHVPYIVRALPLGGSGVLSSPANQRHGNVPPRKGRARLWREGARSAGKYLRFATLWYLDSQWFPHNFAISHAYLTQKVMSTTWPQTWYNKGDVMWPRSGAMSSERVII